MNLRFLILLLLSCAPAVAASRITLNVQVIGTPAENDTLVVNGDTRTWKASVTSPGTQIAVGSGIGGNATNLYNHLASTPYTTLTLVRNGTNAVQLIGTVGQTITASIAGTWASLTLSTQTVTSASVVRVPITAEPTASAQTNIASQLLADLFNNGLASNTVAASSAAMANFVDTSENQTIAGAKSFTGANTYANASQSYSGGYITNVNARTLKVPYDTNLTGLFFYDENGDVQSAIVPDADGYPSLYDHTTETNAFSVSHNVTPAAQHILNRTSADLRYGQLAGNQTFSGTNQFTEITNSIIKGSVLTLNNYSGDVTALTNGTYRTPTLQSAVNRVTAFQSYINDASNFEAGSGAAVASGKTGSVSIGQASAVSDFNSVAVGRNALAGHTNATAIGYNAATYEHNQIVLGTSVNHVSLPNDLSVGDNLVVGSDDDSFPASLAKGIWIPTGTAASADPSSGVVLWSDNGVLRYRSATAGEGSGGSNWAHNRSAEVVGAGSSYTLTGSYALLNFGSTPLQISLPTAGTYRISAVITYTESGAGGTDAVFFRFYNNTDGAAVTSSERTISYVPASETAQVILENIITVSAAKTIYVQGYNSTSARGTAVSTQSTVSYIRLY